MDTKEQNKGFAEEFKDLLYGSCLEFDIHILSDDKCCRLLAWLYIYGGGCEAVTMNSKLHGDILYAQSRLNLFGGERPNAELVRIYQQYLKSISDNLFGLKYLAKKPPGSDEYEQVQWQKDIKNPPEWVYELEKEYGLKIKDEAR